MDDCPKCTLYRQHIGLLENEKGRLNADYVFISDACHRLLGQCARLLGSVSEALTDEQREIAVQVIRGVRLGVIKKEG